MFTKVSLKDYDYLLIVELAALTIIGILAVGSADPVNQTKQMIGFAIGFVLMIVISLVDYRFILKFYWLYYILMLGLLLLVVFKGETTGGAQRWITIGVRFQPSEPGKILLILFFAQFIMKVKDKIKDIRIILIMCALAAVPMLFIYKQPDMSTAIVYGLVFLTILVVGQVPWKYLLTFFGIAIPLVAVVFILLIQPDSILIEKKIMKPYHQTRVLAWLHPEDYETEEAFQQLNAEIAIGSGQLTGKGLNNNVVNSVKNGNFISEPQTDFIFTIIGEELGFIGSATVIVLMIGITLNCLYVAYRAPDVSGRIIAAGIAAQIGFQSFIHIAVNIRLLPNTGLPLPFVSEGLTSLVSCYAGMGFVLSVRLRCDKK